MEARDVGRGLEDIAEKMRASREKRRDGIMYHVGRPGEDHFTNRAIQSWGVDGHNSHTNICSAGARSATPCGAALATGRARITRTRERRS